MSNACVGGKYGVQVKPAIDGAALGLHCLIEVVRRALKPWRAHGTRLHSRFLCSLLLLIRMTPGAPCLCDAHAPQRGRAHRPQRTSWSHASNVERDMQHIRHDRLASHATERSLCYHHHTPRLHASHITHRSSHFTHPTLKHPNLKHRASHFNHHASHLVHLQQPLRVALNLLTQQHSHRRLYGWQGAAQAGTRDVLPACTHQMYSRYTARCTVLRSHQHGVDACTKRRARNGMTPTTARSNNSVILCGWLREGTECYCMKGRKEGSMHVARPCGWHATREHHPQVSQVPAQQVHPPTATR